MALQDVLYREIEYQFELSWFECVKHHDFTLYDDEDFSFRMLIQNSNVRILLGSYYAYSMYDLHSFVRDHPIKIQYITSIMFEKHQHLWSTALHTR